MNIDGLLPIGSIVELKNIEKKFMIFGVKQTSAEESDGKTYDYVGVVYPEGNIGTDYQILFNHDTIENVIFYGYENEERDYFLNELKKQFEPENAFDIPGEPLEEELNAVEPDFD